MFIAWLASDFRWGLQVMRTWVPHSSTTYCWTVYWNETSQGQDEWRVRQMVSHGLVVGRPVLGQSAWTGPRRQRLKGVRLEVVTVFIVPQRARHGPGSAFRPGKWTSRRQPLPNRITSEFPRSDHNRGLRHLLCRPNTAFLRHDRL